MRISLDGVGKALGMLYLIRNHLSKLPLTREYLKNECESKIDHQVRKVNWAASQIIKNNQELKGWKIKQIAGLTGTQIEEVDNAIRELVNTHIKNTGYNDIEI